MIAANLLLVENRRASTPSYAPLLEKKGYVVRIEHTARQALRTFAVFVPDVVIIDAISLRTSGVRMCRSVRAVLDGTPIMLLTPENSTPAPYPGANLVLVQPFTGRKVLNGVARLLPFDHSGSCLQAGALKLNIVQRRVSCGEREDRLTPRQVRLLEVFMRNPGQLLSRKFLIKYVWDTAFVGDTRTLDVHISWLRRILEPDPSHPRYLRTIRGSGYRLDLPEEGRK